MKEIRTLDAVGHVICHDITQIIKDVKKDVVFRKGHVVKEEDIPVLLSVGKEHLYVWEKQKGMLHENEAAEILYDICKNDYMKASDVKEGKINLIADIDGLFKVNSEKLYKLNSMDDIIIATRRGDTAVKKGEQLAGARIIPLIIEEKKIKAAQEIVSDKPLLKLMPFNQKKVSVIVTGSELFHGIIEDKFGPVVIDKFKYYNAEILSHVIVDDNKEEITKAIISNIEDGADIVACSGGMSVDPDDRTPGAIRDTGAEIVTYGAPVLPGAMFLLGYYNYKGKEVPIVGLPGCVMYSKITVFDLVLPRIMADDRITKAEINKLGEGGLCLNCDICTFPNCGLGK